VLASTLGEANLHIGILSNEILCVKQKATPPVAVGVPAVLEAEHADLADRVVALTALSSIS